jgi:LPS sulfotransferase NodH
MIKPILFTTPRTGSTLITRLLGNISIQQCEYKNTLHEYFTINSVYKSYYKKNRNGITTLVSQIITNYKWFDSERTIRLNRLQLLDNDYNYMIKLFSSDIEPEIEHMITQNYDIIYLERRDKIKQLLSWLNLMKTTKAHYSLDDNSSIEQIVYDPKLTNIFLSIIERYHQYKKLHPSKFSTIYYEDFIDADNKELFLLNHLGLANINHVYDTIDTKPSPYKQDPEMLIQNDIEWKLAKPGILQFLNTFN